MINIPDTFQAPDNIKTDYFLFRKLCFLDARLDYDAVMSSIDIIHQTRGGTWPDDKLTYLDDQIDLGWHQREFENRSSFAYTIMTLDEIKCLGCAYLYPPGFRSEMSENADVDVSFWVTQDAYDQGMYPIVYKFLQEFLSEWPFKKIVFTNKNLLN